jgi:chorismate mutase
MAVRGVRGATTVERDRREDIIERTMELLDVMLEKNGIDVAEIASAVFSVTGDLSAEFPAVAARNLGWIYTPLFCNREIPVPGSLDHCIRVLLHVNTDKRQDEMVHAYLYGAIKLRPDLDTSERDRYYISDK